MIFDAKRKRGIKMNIEQREFRIKQSIIASEIARIQNKPIGKLYGLAGSWINKWGFNLTLNVLSRMHFGTSIHYIVGALRREYSKINIIKIPTIEKVANKWKI